MGRKYSNLRRHNNISKYEDFRILDDENVIKNEFNIDNLPNISNIAGGKSPKTGGINRRPNVRNLVRVCVFILPGANMEDNRLEEDFRIASEIWGFNFEIEQPAIDEEDPIFIIEDADLECLNTTPNTPAEEALLNFRRTACPSNNRIAVFYTGADLIGGNTRACTKLTAGVDPSSEVGMNTIFMTNTFAVDTLAHELGHAFFFSNANNRGDADLTRPGIQTHVEGNPTNTMAPGEIRTYPSSATQQQIERAREANSPQLVFSNVPSKNLVEDTPYFGRGLTSSEELYCSCKNNRKRLGKYKEKSNTKHINSNKSIYADNYNSPPPKLYNNTR